MAVPRKSSRLSKKSDSDVSHNCVQGFIQEFTLGGVSKTQGVPPLPLPFPPLPLEVGPLKSS